MGVRKSWRIEGHHRGAEWGFTLYFWDHKEALNRIEELSTGPSMFRFLRLVERARDGSETTIWPET